MNYKLILKSTILFLFFQSCYSQNQPIDNKVPVWDPEVLDSNYKKAYFASGLYLAEVKREIGESELVRLVVIK